MRRDTSVLGRTQLTQAKRLSCSSDRHPALREPMVLLPARNLTKHAFCVRMASTVTWSGRSSLEETVHLASFVLEEMHGRVHTRHSTLKMSNQVSAQSAPTAKVSVYRSRYNAHRGITNRQSTQSNARSAHLGISASEGQLNPNRVMQAITAEKGQTIQSL